MNKPNGQFVMLQGPKMAKNPDGTDCDTFTHITIVKNDDKLDITGYEFTQMIGGIEQWTYTGVEL